MPRPSLLFLPLTLLLACGDKDDDGGYLPPTGSGSGGSSGGGDGGPVFAEELGYDRDGTWVRLDADYEGLYGVPPAFSCSTTADGLYEVEGSVVLAQEDEGFRAARLYFPGEPEPGATYTFAAPLAYNAADLPIELAEGTAALIIAQGTGAEAQRWVTDTEAGELAIELQDGASSPRYLWLDAGLAADADGAEARSDEGHLRCG